MQKYVTVKNTYDRERSKHLVNIISKIKETINLSEFVEMTRDIWDQKFYDILITLMNNLIFLDDYSKYFTESSKINLKIHKDSKSMSFKTLNFAIMMLNLGNSIEVLGNHFPIIVIKICLYKLIIYIYIFTYFRSYGSLRS